MVRRNSWFCRACHKTSFPSERGALRFVARIQHDNPTGRKPRRAYECPYSNGWHLTSQEERETA